MKTGLRDRLAQMSDDELLALAPERGTGWSGSGTITVDGEPAFVKRLPLTEVELAHPRSTKNRFRLPTYYSYGVGSAGFGAWREVAAHEATTGIDGFPELLHTRVLPRTAPSVTLPWSDEEYVTYWNGSAAVGAFMAARDAATHEVWVVLEHVPFMGFAWLLMNQAGVDDFLDQLFAAIGRLGALDVVHFDAHLGNVVVGDGVVRLCDFGLALAGSFELSAAERRFLDRHRHYDAATVLGSLGLMYTSALGHGDADRLGVDIDAIDDAPVAYAPELKAAFRRYREPIVYMVQHFDRMQRPSKRSTYDDADMARLLRAAGVPT